MTTNEFQAALESNAALGNCRHDEYAEIATCDMEDPSPELWAAGLTSLQGFGYYQLVLTGLRQTPPPGP